jgi:hypothetical protein
VGNGERQYSAAEVERAMKAQEVILRAYAGKLNDSCSTFSTVFTGTRFGLGLPRCRWNSPS